MENKLNKKEKYISLVAKFVLAVIGLTTFQYCNNSLVLGISRIYGMESRREILVKL